MMLVIELCLLITLFCKYFGRIIRKEIRWLAFILSCFCSSYAIRASFEFSLSLDSDWIWNAKFLLSSDACVFLYDILPLSVLYLYHNHNFKSAYKAEKQRLAHEAVDAHMTGDSAPMTQSSVSEDTSSY